MNILEEVVKFLKELDHEEQCWAPNCSCQKKQAAALADKLVAYMKEQW